METRKTDIQLIQQPSKLQNMEKIFKNIFVNELNIWQWNKQKISKHQLIKIEMEWQKKFKKFQLPWPPENSVQDPKKIWFKHSGSVYS